MRMVDDQKEDSLAPLRKAIGEVANLNEAVTRAEVRPEEERLRSPGRELSRMRSDLMLLERALMMSQDPS